MTAVAPVDLSKNKGSVFGAMPESNQHPAGLTDHVSDRLETPDEMLKRVLFDGERVEAQFDCYFPSHYLPRWKLIMLIIGTLGMYLFVLWYRQVMTWFYRNKCCTPAHVQFDRKKMAVTNKGRIIVWDESVNQIKQGRSCCDWFFMLCCRSLCAAPAKYNYQMKTSIFSAYKIRQISQLYSSKAAAVFCCLSYEAVIEIAFDNFNHANPYTGCVRTTDSMTFVQKVQSMLATAATAVANGTVLNYDNNPGVLHIVTATEDRQHDGIVQDVFEDMVNLYAKVMAVLPPMPNVFVKNKSIPVGDYSTKDQMSDVTLVADDGKITVPKKWLPLLPGEEILATYGEVYRLKWFEWVLTILSLGYYYCFPCDDNMRLKKVKRTALLLTNKRLISLDVQHRAGMIPSHMTRFTFHARSYFPGTIDGGYINSSSSRCRSVLESSLMTSGGQLLVKLAEQRSLPFIKAMHNTALRQNSPLRITSNKEPNSPDKMDDAERNIIPFLHEEKILSYAKSTAAWQPFLRHPLILDCWNAIRKRYQLDPVTNVCSKESVGPCFPFGVHCLTCGLRPFRAEQDLVITETAFISVISTRNHGFLGFFGKTITGLCTTMQRYTVTWAPAHRFVGQNLLVSGGGEDNYRTRICKNNCIGRIFCPIDDAKYELSLFLENFTISVHGRKKNKNWLQDPELLAVLKDLDSAQINMVTHANKWGKSGKTDFGEGIDRV